MFKQGAVYGIFAKPQFGFVAEATTQRHMRDYQVVAQPMKDAGVMPNLWGSRCATKRRQAAALQGDRQREGRILMLISMNKWRPIKRTLAVLLILVAGYFVVLRTDGHGEQRVEKVAREQWEYLVVAGPSTTNFEPTSNPSMRKESNAGFAREAFVLEQHLDRLGRKGWELIDVAGPPTDPAYYFRRRK